MKTFLTFTLAAITALTAGFVSAADTPLLAPFSGGRVLILSTTINPATTASWEAQAAMGLGFVVDIATPAQWSAISAASCPPGIPPTGFLRFGQYWALILGDPTCTGSPAPLAAADSTKACWSPIIRNGNQIINGEDFAYHAGGQFGARNFITNAIRFATDCPTNTGLYVSLSCYYSGVGNTVTPVSALSLVSLAGTFSVVGGNHNKAKVVAAHPALAGLTDANLSNFGCSSHNLFRVRPSDFTVLAMMLDADAVNRIHPSMGTNGAPYILAKGKGLKSLDDCCVNIASKPVECIETNMTYRWDFCITNCWTNAIKYFSFLDLPTGVTMSEDIITLPSELKPGQGTCYVLYITNTPALTNLCIKVGAHTTNFDICCSTNICLTLPPCCVWIFHDFATPITGKPNCYTYQPAVIKNVSSTPMTYLFFVPQPDAPNNCFSFSPNVMTFNPPVLPGQSASLLQRFPQTLKLTITPGCPMPFCFLASLHDSNLVKCCSSREYITHVMSPIIFPGGVDGEVFPAGTTVRVPVLIDRSAVGAKSVTLRASWNSNDTVRTIIDPADGQHDDWLVLSNTMPGTYVVTAALTDALDGVWDAEPVSFRVVEDQHLPPAPAPLLFVPAAAVNAGLVRFLLRTDPGVTCYVEYTDSLSPANWQVFQTIVGDGTTVTVVDSVSNARQRFFRVRMP